MYGNGRPLPYRGEGVFTGVGKGVGETGDNKLTEGLQNHPHFVLERDISMSDCDLPVPAGK